MSSRLTKFSAACALGLGCAGLFACTVSNEAVLIQSEESTTKDSGPVFNRISFESTPNEDIWRMQQSHHGLNAPAETWEHLGIVVDKTKSPKVAKFYQFADAADDFSKQKTYRASCFMCHSNGPRAVRPDQAEDIRIALWNLRVKTYGRVVLDPKQVALKAKEEVPLRYASRISNERLSVKTCLKCHREDGFVARGVLTRQNSLAIEFMVEKGYMPPAGFHLQAGEAEEIRAFINGL
jgi:cytochrome c5